MSFITWLMIGNYFMSCNVEKLESIRQTGNDQIVTVEAESGHQFDFYGNGFEVGDSVIMFMDNKGTIDITDDEVIDVFCQ